MQRTVRLLFFLIILSACLARCSYAEEHDWLLTYPYETADKGDFEFAQWHNAGDSLAENPEEWFEFEYGVTSHDMASFYLVRNSGSFTAKAWKVENIWRIGNPGEFILDPALYLEYRNNDAAGQPGELEGKLILQKHLRDLQLSSNFVWENPLNRSGGGIRFNRFHVAASYPISEKKRVALEFTRYVQDQITSLTPEINASLGHSVRVLAGWEIPVSGMASGRLRTGFEFEF